MSRTKITSTSNSIGSDSGNVLFSFIQGEQQEYEISMDFLTDITGYEFEAVVMEGDNNGTSAPIMAKAGGVNTELVIRLPNNRGVWSASNTYNAEDMVSYNGQYYKLTKGANYTTSTLPTADTNWVPYVNNKANIQFPKALSADWTFQPTPENSTYGFFEFRVSEPAGTAFPKTWKPVRGMIEFEFSPTSLVD